MAVGHHLEIVRRNAFRLFRDVRLLFQHERWASCVALSVLVIEEVGKYLILSSAPDDPRLGKLSHHPTKQSALSGGYLAELWVAFSGEISDENWDVFLHRMEELRALGPIDEIFSRPMHHTPASDARQAAFEEKVLQHVGKLLTARFIEKTGIGETNKTKNRAFYVDAQFDGRVLNDPARFTRSDAEEWMAQANRALDEIGYDE